ncbi:MAG: fatty acid desaturase [Pseudomonadota bacterium]
MTNRPGQGEALAPPERRSASRAGIEWPTWIIIVLCHGAWAAVTLAHDALPMWIFIPFAAYLVTLHSSIQHEAIHGHPTRWRRVNEALVYFPLGLLVPYRRFRTLHLRHHRDERLTDPYDDPESWYVCPDQWAQHSRWLRLVKSVNATLAGRLLAGPLLAAIGLLRADAARIAAGDRAIARAWSHHAAGLVPVVIWLELVCGVSIVIYALCVAYPAMSLLLLRSYAEHRAAGDPNHRTAIIEASPLFGLLFLNNNLHYVHHVHPRAAWYRLPAMYRGARAEYLSGNAGYGYAGYGALLRRCLFRPHDTITHPRERLQLDQRPVKRGYAPRVEGSHS